jgi:hypothetical protein
LVVDVFIATIKPSLLVLTYLVSMLSFFDWQIFTLSAIPYDIMLATLRRCVSVLKPGGLVLFRDYGNISDMLIFRLIYK